jgi:hypothetical protein
MGIARGVDAENRQFSDMEMAGRVSINCFRVLVFIISEFCRHLVKMAVS